MKKPLAYAEHGDLELALRIVSHAVGEYQLEIGLGSCWHGIISSPPRLGHVHKNLIHISKPANLKQVKVQGIDYGWQTTDWGDINHYRFNRKQDALHFTRRVNELAKVLICQRGGVYKND